jgi:hypothetical protein
MPTALPVVAAGRHGPVPPLDRRLPAPATGSAGLPVVVVGSAPRGVGRTLASPLPTPALAPHRSGARGAPALPVVREQLVREHVLRTYLPVPGLPPAPSPPAGDPAGQGRPPEASTPTTVHSGHSRRPPAAPAAAVRPAEPAGVSPARIDIERIVDKVHRRLMHRLVVEGERRGMTR